jgi:hypothetical protein
MLGFMDINLIMANNNLRGINPSIESAVIIWDIL